MVSQIDAVGPTSIRVQAVSGRHHVRRNASASSANTIRAFGNSVA